MVLTLDLPSKGRMRRIPKVLKVKEWTLEDIKDLSKSADASLDDVFVDVLNRRIVREGLEPKFEPGMLCEQDRLYIVLTMRVNILGGQYEFYYTHSELDGDGKELCGHKQEVKVDLTKMEIKDIPDIYQDHMYIELPSCKEQVRVALPSYAYTRDSKQVWEKARGVVFNDVASNDPELILFWTALYFSGVNDQRFSNIMESIKWLQDRDVSDAAALIDIHEFFSNWGPDMIVTGKCEKCQKEYSFRFPFLNSFFFDKTKFKFDIKSAVKSRPSDERRP